MASRCRSCRAPLPRRITGYPPAEQLARLEPYLGILVDAAAEFMACSDSDLDHGNPVEFVQWLRVDVVRGNRGDYIAGHPGTKEAA